jgi:hypothetical protein
MNRFLRITIAAFSATSVMTLWSKGVSRLDGRQHSEPALLNRILDRRSGVNVEGNGAPGWIIHYAVGYLFVTGYDFLWRTRRVRKTLKNDTILGAVSGLIGAAAWSMVHKIAPEIKTLKKQSYYVQLVAAHVVFSCIAAVIHRSLEEDQLNGSASHETN